MINSGKLAGLTLFITGASRGIGKAIALKAAKDGANVVVAAKTAQPHPKLPGTIYTAVEEIEKAGGKGLPCIVDVRDENQIRTAVEAAVAKFGGIDIVINNASAINLSGTEEIDMKRFDLMHQINTRGTFLVSKVCIPYLKKSNHAHILNLSPPLAMEPRWFSNHVAYTMAKYGMSMCVLGMHEELRPLNIAVNALWPRTAIMTAAMEMLVGGAETAAKVSRTPEIMSDAAYAILTSDPKTTTGNFFMDDEVLAKQGVTDLNRYRVDPTSQEPLLMDAFVDPLPDQPSVQFPSGGGASKKDGAASPTGKVASIFSAIERNLSEEQVAKTNACFQFILTGEEPGKWYVDLKNGKGSCGQGEPSTKADATLTMDSKNFFDMFNGKIKPASAFMMGKLKIKGNLQQAMKLEKLMSSLKSKL